MSTTIDERLPPVVVRCRPALVWVGLVAFLVGAVVLGRALATASDAFAGPELMLAGVGLVGLGFALPASGGRYDPDIEFEGWRRGLLAGLGGLALAVAVLVAVAALV